MSSSPLLALFVLITAVLARAAAASSSRWTLKGKSVLVTGGTKGIGRAIVEEMGAMGASVLTCARNEAEMQAALSEWQSQGMEVEGVIADVTKDEDRQQLLAKAKDLFKGRLDVLVNNVGANIRKPTVEYDEAEFTQLFQVNQNSFFSLTKGAHPLLKAAAQMGGQEGTNKCSSCIINISSVGGMVPIKSGSPYGMNKAAMNHATRFWACEFAKDHIRVNCVCPWYTNTPLAAPVLQDKAKLAEIIDRTPMGRIATAEEVSGLCAFLAMPAASYITGQNIAIDGGFTCNGWMS